MHSKKPSKTLRRLFCGVTENTFEAQLGVVDPPLVDYLSDLLMRFVRQDALERVRNLMGQRVRDVGGMLVEAESRIGEARRDVHRHIGDYTLFWAGLFPEALRRHPGTLVFDQFHDFCTYGKRAYLIAGTIETSRDKDAPNDLLLRLSNQFEMCAYGLREVRRELERRDDEDEPPRPFLIN
jgi:hypothetical protein